MVGIYQFNQAARKTLALAQQEAIRSGHNKIGPGHILLGLIQDEGVAGKILMDQGANLVDVRRIVANQTPASEKAGAQPVRVDLLDTTQRMLELTIEVKKQKKQDYIGCEHLLLSLIKLEDDRTKKIMASAGLDRDKIREHIQ